MFRWEQSHFVYVFYEKHVLLNIFEQQTENWHFHEKSPHKVPYLPLTTSAGEIYLQQMNGDLHGSHIIIVNFRI